MELKGDEAAGRGRCSVPVRCQQKDLDSATAQVASKRDPEPFFLCLLKDQTNQPRVLELSCAFIQFARRLHILCQFIDPAIALFSSPAACKLAAS